MKKINHRKPRHYECSVCKRTFIVNISDKQDLLDTGNMGEPNCRRSYESWKWTGENHCWTCEECYHNGNTSYCSIIPIKHGDFCTGCRKPIPEGINYCRNKNCERYGLKTGIVIDKIINEKK